MREWEQQMNKQNRYIQQWKKILNCTLLVQEHLLSEYK